MFFGGWPCLLRGVLVWCSIFVDVSLLCVLKQEKLRKNQSLLWLLVKKHRSSPRLGSSDGVMVFVAR